VLEGQLRDANVGPTTDPTERAVLMSLLREKFEEESSDNGDEDDLTKGFIDETPQFDANVEALGRVSRKLRMSSRVREACEVVPNMIDSYFEILLKDAPSHCVLSTLRKVFRRFEFVFGPRSYRIEVRKRLLKGHDRTFLSWSENAWAV